jgi:hypothetical protein
MTQDKRKKPSAKPLLFLPYMDSLWILDQQDILFLPYTEYLWILDPQDISKKFFMQLNELLFVYNYLSLTIAGLDGSKLHQKYYFVANVYIAIFIHRLSRHNIGISICTH